MSLFLPILALLIAVLALAYAWKLQQELDKATSRLDRYNRAIFQNSDELRKLREALDEQTAATRVQWMKMTGGQFTADTTVREAQLLHPQAGQILAGFHIGGCSSCAVEPDTALHTVAEQNGISLPQLLGNLNLLVAAGDNGHATTNGGPALVKIPNVSLEL
jgi:hypothetical protein